MKVYVIRHGQSESNLKGYWTGWLDVNLTEGGREDAKKAGKFLKDITFDRVFSSDLVRAIDTARIATGCEPETTALVREINVGNIAGKPLDIVTDEQRIIFRKDGYAEIEGESRAEFAERVEMFKSYIEELDCDNVAVFSHAGWLMTMLDSVVGIKFPRKNILCGNCAIGVFEYNGSDWKLYSWINL